MSVTIAAIGLGLTVLGLFTKIIISDTTHKSRTKSLEEEHQILRKDFDDWVDGDRPGRGCKIMIDSNREMIFEQKRKLSDQIGKNIETEKTIIEIKSDLKYLVSGIDDLKRMVGFVKNEVSSS